MPIVDNWIKKKWYMYVMKKSSFTYLMKKNGILSFVKTWMDLEGIMLSEKSKSKKDKYPMISFICGL